MGGYRACWIQGCKRVNRVAKAGGGGRGGGGGKGQASPRPGCQGPVFCVAKVELDPDGGCLGAHTRLHGMINPQVIT